MPAPPRTWLLGWVVAACLSFVGCDSRKLPRFADPPPVDAGLDAAADEDAGDEPRD